MAQSSIDTLIASLPSTSAPAFARPKWSFATNQTAARDETVATSPDMPLADIVEAISRQSAEVDADIECMAKAVYHEAANQPLAGQLAVAEVIVNRTLSGRFAITPCAVVNQRGQFFDTHAYRPPTSSRRWAVALAIARIARTGNAPKVAPGALFFCSRRMHARSRSDGSLVAQIGDQIFYR